MIDAQAKDAFWRVVEDCLVELHGLPRPEARARSVDLRSRLEAPPIGLSPDIVYHDEPNAVAHDLAGYETTPVGQGRGRDDDLERYQAIVRRHHW